MVPEVRILSDEEVRLLHTRALDILGKVGIKYESTKALNLLADHGRGGATSEGRQDTAPEIRRPFRHRDPLEPRGGRLPAPTGDLIQSHAQQLLEFHVR